MPVVLYLRGLCHLHLSTGSPEDKLPRNKNTEKIICLPAARASSERRAKGPLGFSTNAGKRRAEDRDVEVTGRRRKKWREEARATHGGKGTTPARREKSAEVRQERMKEKIQRDYKEKRREGGRERERKTERESLLLGLRLPRSR